MMSRYRSTRRRGLVPEPLERRVLFATGSLDPSFSGDGVATFDHGNRDNGIDVVVQADGKMVVIGRTGNDPDKDLDFALVRFNVDGTPDPTFGNAGLAVTDFGGEDTPMAAAQASDGSIWVVGGTGPRNTSTEEWAVARYTADGAPDLRFDGDGKEVFDLGESAQDITIQSDGKLLVVGPTRLGEFGVMRLTADGAPDPGFGDGGVVTTAFHTRGTYPRSVDVAPDGRIIVGGWIFNGDAFGAVARYLADGQLDPSFDHDGRVFLDRNSIDDLAVQPDGKIVLLQGDLSLARLNLNGTYDDRFADGGTLRVQAGAADGIQSARKLLQQPDGRLLASGLYAHNSHGTWDTLTNILFRATPDGRLDPGFGDGGIVRVPDEQDRSFAALALAPDGKIAAAGTSTRMLSDDPFDFDNDIAAFRFANDVPAQPPPPGEAVTIEAEDATSLRGAVVARSNPGFTGRGYVDFQADSGAAVTWKVNDVPGPGDYTIEFRYANGSRSTRTLAFDASPGTGGTVAFPPTGSWSTWKTVMVPVTLTAGGALTGTLRTTGTNGPNIDSLSARRVGGPPPGGTVYQAEQATLVGARALHSQGGYTGTGYADFTNASGDSVEWTFDHAGGSATLTFRYANGDIRDRPLDLSVNGQIVRTGLSFPPTGSWSAWREVSVTVDLASGTNRVKLAATGRSGANIDSMTVS